MVEALQIRWSQNPVQEAGHPCPANDAVFPLDCLENSIRILRRRPIESANAENDESPLKEIVENLNPINPITRIDVFHSIPLGIPTENPIKCSTSRSFPRTAIGLRP